MRPYIALIHKDAGSDYGVSFPDFPGCITAGTTLDDARSMAIEALTFHVDGMTADNEPLPEPSSLDAIMSDNANRDGVAILIDAPTAAKAPVQLSITLAGDLVERIDRTAQADGLTRSEFIARATERALGRL